MIKLCAFADEANSALEGQIKALNENNIPYLEVRGINGKSVINFTVDEAKEYQKELSDGGVSVWSVGSPLGKIDINDDFVSYIDKVKHVCELANIFNTQRIRMFSFYNAYNEKNKVIDYLSQMVEIAKEYNVFMCHENEKDIYGDVADREIEILDAVKGLRCVYDPANFVVHGHDTLKAFDLLKDYAVYYHIKDAIHGVKVVPAGEGEGNVPCIIEQLKERGFNGFLSLEPHLATGDIAVGGDELFERALGALKKLI